MEAPYASQGIVQRANELKQVIAMSNEHSALQEIW